MDSRIQPRVAALAAAVAALACLWGCPRGPAGPRALVTLEDGRLVTREFGALPPAAAPRTASWDHAVQLVGVRVEPASVAPGGTVSITTYHLLTRDLPEDWQVFLHASAPGGELNVLEDNHGALNGMLPTSRWRPGEVLVETRALHIPDPCPTGQLQLWGGFFRGNSRLPVDNTAEHDGQNRARLGTISVGDGKALPEYAAPRALGAIRVDGVADEKDWAAAPRAGPFFSHDGRAMASQKTWARLLWTPEALFVLFEAEDADIWSSFTQRDDPLFNEEVVEIFLDADADTGTHADPNVGSYSELEAAATDVHFDASFTGRHQGMNTAFTSGFQTRAVINGTLNNPADVDVGWTSEWRIPWADLLDVGAGVKPGQRLRFNLFRLDKVRREERVVENQASAWSSPLSGDFHNVQRFGWLVLQP